MRVEVIEEREERAAGTLRQPAQEFGIDAWGALAIGDVPVSEPGAYGAAVREPPPQPGVEQHLDPGDGEHLVAREPSAEPEFRVTVILVGNEARGRVPLSREHLGQGGRTARAGRRAQPVEPPLVRRSTSEETGV